VGAAVEKLKAKGPTSPYLRAFVASSAEKFNVERVKQDDLAKVGGALADEE
jgi:hypothetical protein